MYGHPVLILKPENILRKKFLFERSIDKPGEVSA